MEEKIVFECLHCGTKNPEYLTYRGEGNACAKCKPLIGYYVVFDNEDTGQTSRMSIGLTKKGTDRFIDRKKEDGTDIHYHNLRVLSFKEFDYKVLLDSITLIKNQIKSNQKELLRLKAELKIKEIEKEN